jgi:hypothetical protein
MVAMNLDRLLMITVPLNDKDFFLSAGFSFMDIPDRILPPEKIPPLMKFML